MAGGTALTALTNPTAAVSLLVLDPADTTTAPANSSGSNKTLTLARAGKVITGWANLVRDFGADPTGTTSVATPLANACAAATAVYPAPYGLTVPPGRFSVTAGQVLPKNLVLQGAGVQGGSVTGTANMNGSVFVVSSSFSGSYVFACDDTADSTAVNAPILSGFGIVGSAYTAEPVDGIVVNGPAFLTMSYVSIVEMSGNGVNTHVDTTATPIGADGQIWSNVTIDSCALNGARLIYPEDSQFHFCYIIGCGGDGWQICGGDNSHWSHCRGEWNGGYGLHLTNITDGGTPYDWTYAPGYATFDSFSTDANTQSGIRCDATFQTGQGAGTGACMIQLTSPSCRRDGKGESGAAGSWAGIDVNYSAAAGGSAGLPVYVGGCPVVTTGIGDGGSGTIGPRYGIIATSLGAAPFKVGGVGMLNGYSAAATTSGTVTNYALASTVDTYAGYNYNYTG
jgi:hypothetical protein